MKDTKHEITYRTVDYEMRRRWWKLPFDATTNFSLFGYFLGGFRWNDPKKRTDFTLENE
ncbi:MAG: hypothetical protein ACE5EB_01965 [Thermodesulfobacteriota bacterium]